MAKFGDIKGEVKGHVCSCQVQAISAKSLTGRF
jgi:hypothetical protein